jgi:hypothetical protein
MLQKFSLLRFSRFEQRIEKEKYGENLLNYIHKIIRDEYDEEKMFSILLRLSKEWQHFNIVLLKEHLEHTLYGNLVTIIEAKGTRAFRLKLINTVDIITEFKLPFVRNLGEEKIVLKQLDKQFKADAQKYERRHYYRELFKQNIYFSVLIVKEWQKLVHGFQEDVFWIRIYLQFSINNSLIAKITEYLIEHYPVKFLPEISQVLHRKVDEFAQPTTLRTLGRELIKQLLIKHQYSTKHVYELVKDEPVFLKHLSYTFEHHLIINNYAELFNIEEKPVLTKEKIYHLYHSKNEGLVSLGKLITGSNYESQLRFLIKKACFADDHEDYATFTIDTFKFTLIHIGNYVSDNAPMGYDWLLLTQGKQSSLDCEILRNVFTSDFIEKVMERI